MKGHRSLLTLKSDVESHFLMYRNHMVDGITERYSTILLLHVSWPVSGNRLRIHSSEFENHNFSGKKLVSPQRTLCLYGSASAH